MRHSRSRVLYQGRLIDLHLEHLRLANGTALELEIVRHPGGAVAVALDDSQRVCLLRQHRHAAGGMLWETPAGVLDPHDPSPLAAAQRELAEEAGLTAELWTDLGAVLPSPGYTNERLHLFLARKLTAGPCAHHPDEVIEIQWLPFEQALRMATSGEICDAKTVIALFRAAQVLDYSHSRG